MAALIRRIRDPLAREVTVALAVKVAALALLYLAFFGPWQRTEVTAEGVENALLGAPSSVSDATSHEERR